jgi:DNA-binding response OmpR family regulator
LVRVLVVENERKIAAVVADAQADHYDVVVAGNGEEGSFRASGCARRSTARAQRV